MSRTAIDLVIAGQVMLSVTADGVQTAGAIGIGEGRVQLAGDEASVLRAAAPSARVLRVGDVAVVPGLHDFHLHLVGMARQRREVRLDGLDGASVTSTVVGAASGITEGAWLRGRGWSEAALSDDVIDRLNEAVGDLPALLYSHDAHSAWASPAALLRAGINAGMDDPPGGRIERDAAGEATGILRETATDLVDAVAERLRGQALDAALDDVVAELGSWGVTGATDAGDTSAESGIGPYADLGDRASLLLSAAERLDSRLRLAVGFPAAAIGAAAALGLVTGTAIPGTTTIRAGWAKAYADGALGSRTAAVFEPYTCPPGDTGILRLQPDQLDLLLAEGRRHRISLAVHAIGDRAAAAVLDAFQRAGAPNADAVPHRIEHLQLLRPHDRDRLAQLDVTASLQPVHCAADREHVGRCWSDRAGLAYPWASLQEAGTRLAFGSDAPIETPNPWSGIFAAAHRRLPGDGTADWQPSEALASASALAGYTRGPALAARRTDEGHLRPGAVADLAVLNVDLPTLLAADDRLAGVRSVLTLVNGREVHRA